MTLREWIKAQKLSQREAAAMLDVHLVTLNRWLCGHLMPSRDALMRIRTVTEGQVTADSFLDGRTPAPLAPVEERAA
jgi:transcriptional regulator with XRE-family HTH domain